jgi:hypothetical protein
MIANAVEARMENNYLHQPGDLTKGSIEILLRYRPYFRGKS